MEIRITDTIGGIVSANINTASVFSNYGINFYSEGIRTVEHVCVDQNVPMMELLEDLYDIAEDMAPHRDFRTMTVSALTSYIIRNHHKFTKQRLIYLRNTIERVVAFAGGDEISALIKEKLAEFSVYLTVHMQHEEFIVFPAIHKLAKGKVHPALAMYELEGPVESMISDHDQEVEMIHRFEKLASRYQSATHSDYAEKAVYTAMQDLTNDLKIHMHLENNILIPKVLDFTRAHARNFN